MHWHQQQRHHRMQCAVVDDNSERGTHIDTASSLPHTTTTPTITTPPTPLVPELQEAEEPVISAATPPSPGDSPTPATPTTDSPQPQPTLPSPTPHANCCPGPQKSS
eukprot:TRINITY_DN627_c0_g1_i6.p1 TRINITY_DN627_c0_g1~~TRINITY_DN627_c0_g1_i6.p1  ORF type:complete len:107 (-),score=30.37 TRINITY_DN627_c0_g1_i6:159-479(-)